MMIGMTIAGLIVGDHPDRSGSIRTISQRFMDIDGQYPQKSIHISQIIKYKYCKQSRLIRSNTHRVKRNQT